MNGKSHATNTAGKSMSVESADRTTNSSTNHLTPCKRNLSHKLVQRYTFRLRCFLLIGVIIVFYVKFLVTSNYQEPVHLNSVQSSTIKIQQFSRKLLHSISENKDNITASNTSIAVNCTTPSIEHFPSDGLTRSERQSGFIIIHVLIALYCFWFLASICDEYFVPAIEQICRTLKLQKDVVGATVMAAATSSPGLFMNCVGTFVTKGDIGVGTIVGSSVFNILAVPACCGIFVGHQYMRRLDWWPITRDCGMYCVAVFGLIAVLYDEKIMWYEALMLVIGYFAYIAVMYNNDDMARLARKLISKYRRRHNTYGMHMFVEVNELHPLVVVGSNNNIKASSMDLSQNSRTLTVNINNSNESDISICVEYADCPWQRNNRCIFEFICRWPITCLLWMTMPDSRRHPNFKYLTFLLSICWIGVISYLAAYVITILGDTLDIPDSVMGLTVLAAGMSVPEAVSSIIVTKAGHGAMGISNSIGSNTFDILLCLGLPWFVKAYFFPAHPNEQWITLNSVGLMYSTVFLLTALLSLYIAFVANKFMLNWKIGVACTIMYIGFIVIASMIELNVFFHVNLPICKH